MRNEDFEQIEEFWSNIEYLSDKEQADRLLIRVFGISGGSITKPETKIFGQKICTREECPAFFDTVDGYGGCNAKLGYVGRITLENKHITFGMVCKLPVEFELIRSEDV